MLSTGGGLPPAWVDMPRGDEVIAGGDCEPANDDGDSSSWQFIHKGPLTLITPFLLMDLLCLMHDCTVTLHAYVGHRIRLTWMA